jgi:hypothetical protein
MFTIVLFRFFSTPKYLVLSIGMNIAYTNWQSEYYP